MATITNSVGNGGVNESQDVRVVQELLNRRIRLLAPVRPLKVDGDCGPLTIGTILEFQRRVMEMPRPDGRVDPGKATIKKLDEEAALRSASWGMFQIMGFNHAKAGHATVRSFVDAMKQGEAEQLMAFIKFIESEGLGGYLKSKQWAEFAKAYNGPGYAENKYDIRLAQAYEAYSAG